MGAQGIVSGIICLHNDDLHYNFARVHQTLGVTPAQAAGVADHRWHVEEIVALLLVKEAEPVNSRA